MGSGWPVSELISGRRSQDAVAPGRWVGEAGERGLETLAGKGAHACILHPGARQNLPHSSRTRVSHNAQHSGMSFSKKSYFSKFHACSKTWAWVLGCAVQDSLDPKPRGLWAETSTACISSFKFNVFRALAKLAVPF